MFRQRTRWYVTLPSGKRCRVGTRGVLLGRSSRCDVVLASERASRSQAIIYAGDDGPELYVLGKGKTALNDEAVDQGAELRAGDVVSLPGLDVAITREDATGASSPHITGWVIESGGGELFGITRTPFVVGSSPRADVRIATWPPELVRFHASHDRLHAEAVVPVRVDGAEHDAGALVRMVPGTTIEHGDEQLKVVAGWKLDDAQTTLDSHPGLRGATSVVRLEFLPRGGRLSVVRNGEERALYLPDRRCDLVAALLSPPAPLNAGDLIPDEILIPRVWPQRPVTRSNLNVLLHRARRDLEAAGLDGAAMLQRAPGGRATRFAFAPGTRVVVE